MTYRTDAGVVRAVRGVSFVVKPGAFYTLLGASGCGKTTTLRCVAGLEAADQGRIAIGDTVVYSSADRIAEPPYRRDIGMVFQSYAIWPHLSVFDNVAFLEDFADPRWKGASFCGTTATPSTSSR